MEKKRSGKEKVVVVIEEDFGMVGENDDLGVVREVEVRESKVEVGEKMNEVVKGYLNMVEWILGEGKKRGEFREDVDV
ncbi:TetR/AcrR family transcriptional regulator C-terminal domain-containing protein, partial [Bacillus pumilus]|uniref:TetR/AcrR family transcriptional regulator C-terminal domain-containing protein n=1 Tax=Bacillus pumilus TaxID=1408 RepID=UPI0037042121